ncbi:MAG: DUF1236 domain-containing protein, partial [Pararhizobium sp.]
KTLLVAATVIAASIPGYAFAGGGATAGAIGGAATGAVVGGPVGAAVGGVAGAITGAIADPPNEVVTYVQEQPAPSDVTVVHENIAVGSALPADVVVTPIPDHPKYAYAIVNHERVIVDPEQHTVVKIIK